jgi:hypothetical protein
MFPVGTFHGSGERVLVSLLDTVNSNGRMRLSSGLMRGMRRWGSRRKGRLIEARRDEAYRGWELRPRVSMCICQTEKQVSRKEDAKETRKRDIRMSELTD